MNRIFTSIKKYLPYALMAMLAMAAVSLLEIFYIRSRTADGPATVAIQVGPKEFAYMFIFFLVLFLFSLACVKIAERILTSALAQFLLAAMVYSAVDFVFFMAQGAPLQLYFGSWVTNFQFFAISYAFIRIADVRAKRSS